MHARSAMLLALLLALLISVTPARAQDLPVAGDEGHLWLLRPGSDASAATASGDAGNAGAGGTLVLHRGPGDEPSTLGEVETLRGLVRPGGIAASGSEVVLVYADGTVQLIRAAGREPDGTWRYEGATLGSLPGGAELRGLAVSGEGVWVLARMTDAEAEVLKPKPADSRAEAEAARRIRAMVLRLPLDRPLPGETEAPEATPPQAEMRAVEPEPEAPRPTGPEPERDYLLQLRGTQHRWTVLPLPTDWPDARRQWLVAPERGGDRPTLLAHDGDTLRLFEPQGEGSWTPRAYPLPARVSVKPLGLAGQVMLATQAGATAEGLTIALQALRPETMLPLGEVQVDAGEGAAWGAARSGLAVAVVTHTPERDGAAPLAPPQRSRNPLSLLFPPEPPALGLRWARLDLSGAVLQPSAELRRIATHPLERSADLVLMAAIALLALLMLVVFWRRDPSWTRLMLPDELVLAELGRRALAGAIDLAVPVLLVMQWYGLSPLDLLSHHWPGAASFRAIVPGAIVIGLFVLHTTLAESISGRSFGKSLTGLRVTDLSGKRPRLWQLLVRNVLKAFDLVAPLLLVLPSIGPLRQRLGDLMARTVVVMPRGDRDEARPGEDEAPGDREP